MVKRIEASKITKTDSIHFKIENERVERILLKLAMGHALHELNEPQFHRSPTISFSPLQSLSDEDLEMFENLPELTKFPEVGSRSMQRILVMGVAEWIIVQPQLYRYTAFGNGKTTVKIMPGEYLACEVCWD